jgi:hypothetical protein
VAHAHVIAVRFLSLSFLFFRSFSSLDELGRALTCTSCGTRRLQETYGVVPNSGLSTPKEDVYKDYAQMCARDGKSAMARATFGKILHVAFPGITCNRLGRRGTPFYSCSIFPLNVGTCPANWRMLLVA